MDWSYATSWAIDGLLGIVALLFPIPFLFAASTSGRRLAAASPGLFGTVFFLAFLLVSGTTSPQSPNVLGYLPLLGLLVVVASILPSVRALRLKWAGLLHVLTLTGALYTSFVAALAITHDSI